MAAGWLSQATRAQLASLIYLAIIAKNIVLVALLRRRLKRGGISSSLFFLGRRPLKIIRSVASLLLFALFALTGSVSAQPAAISWSDAVGQIAGERAKAETCVALMKKYGDDAQKARGEITYTSAKVDSDAGIAGLIVALSAGQTPASLSSLQTKLSSGTSGLVEFCGAVSNLLPKTAGQTEKGVMVEIAKMIPVEQLLKMLSDGVSALYNNHRSDDALTRHTIQTQLEAARWPAFSEVKAAD
jgi:hypothetical protein